jgi:hypothetical protein
MLLVLPKSLNKITMKMTCEETTVGLNSLKMASMDAETRRSENCCVI